MEHDSTPTHAENWKADWMAFQKTRLAPADTLIFGILQASLGQGLLPSDIADTIEGLALRQWKDLGLQGVIHHVKAVLNRMERQGKVRSEYHRGSKVWAIWHK